MQQPVYMTVDFCTFLLQVIHLNAVMFDLVVEFSQ